MCSTRVSSGLSHKHKARMKRLVSEKCSGLLQTFVNYARKMFYNIGPGSQSHKNIFGVNLFTLYHKLDLFKAMQQISLMLIKWFNLQ